MSNDTSAHPEEAPQGAVSEAQLAEQANDNPLTAFTPVPRQCERESGWTPEVQRAFIEWLADLGSVTEACRMVGRSTTGAYRLKRHPEAGEFAAAWASALAIAVGMVEDNAIDRAINGVEVPIFAYKDKLATRRVYNDRLVMFMLRSHAPDRYCDGGARGLSAIDRRRLERMKKEWRAEWEAEQRAQQPDIEEVRRSILRKIEVIGRAERARWTPREHELHEALEAERAAREAREEAAAEARVRREGAGWRGSTESDPQLAAVLSSPDHKTDPAQPKALPGPDEGEEETEEDNQG